MAASMPPVPEGTSVGRTCENEAGRSWADMVRAAAVLRVAVSAVDRLVRRFGSTGPDPELAMALIESSQSAQRALVMLTEARQLLAGRYARLSFEDAVTDIVTAASGHEGRANSEIPTAAQPSADDGVICRALLLALGASRVWRAWHAGVTDADTAMRLLDSLLPVICTSPSLRYVATNATGRVGFADVEASS
jgi:hypothetical protein